MPLARPSTRQKGDDAVSQMDDAALLRRFEPVLRYTRGERFFPIEVDDYVRQSSLWVQRPGEDARCLVPEGELTLDELSKPRADGFDAVYFLKFIEPMNIVELVAYRLKQMRDQIAGVYRQARFRAGRGRLARVGYLSRLIDALFSLTLLARGRVSGDTSVAASITYQRMMEERERYVYYGRVVRRKTWTVLQYWFFYPFNCWRSGFFGVNDHEADWEMLCVYLCPDDDRPAWVAYASHDFSGDDLRRRWDDPELERVGEHPVVYAGAGSHASYFVKGEYLTELEIAFLAPVRRILDRLQLWWHRMMRQTGDRRLGRQGVSATLRVPFVDYARGDGLSIGPEQEKEWDDPQLLDPTPGWALHYRGLWGLYAHDPIAGENAPAGPLYNRDGRMRRAWYDPVGWAGLDKVLPFSQQLTWLRERAAQIDARRFDLEQEIASKTEELLGLGIQKVALEGQPHLEALHAETTVQAAALSAEIDDLRGRLAVDNTLLEAFDLHSRRLEAGIRQPAQAHLMHPHRPASDVELRLGGLAETWAATSVGLVMVGFVILVLFARQYLAVGVTAMVMVIVLMEAGFRRRLYQFMARATSALALVCSLILIYEFFWPIMVAGVLLAGGYLTIENLRELVRR